MLISPAQGAGLSESRFCDDFGCKCDGVVEVLLQFGMGLIVGRQKVVTKSGLDLGS